MLVPGDPHPPGEAFVPGSQDGAHGSVARVEFGEVGDGVELIEVERIAVQQRQRILHLCAHAVRVVAQGLARHEELVTHWCDERA